MSKLIGINTGYWLLLWGQAAPFYYQDFMMHGGSVSTAVMNVERNYIRQTIRLARSRLLQYLQ